MKTAEVGVSLATVPSSLQTGVSRPRVLIIEDERPLTYTDIRTFTRNFAASDYREFYLLSMLSTRVISNKALARHLLSIDEWILPRARWMRRLCQQVWVGVEASPHVSLSASEDLLAFASPPQ